jgi:hypothetical protein
MSGSTMLATINTSGQMSGSAPVLFASTASFVANAQTASFVALAQTSSFVANAQSASNAVSAQTASFANAFTVANTLTAQTLVVQTITSSVDFVTGSTRFGSVIGNTHVFTGSMAVSGSATFTSTLTTGDVITTNTGGFRTLASQGYALRNDANNANLGGFTRRSYWVGSAALDTQIYAETGYGIFLNVNGNGTLGLNILSSGNVGIGITNPTGSLSIKAEQTNTPTIVFQNSSGGPNSAISNYTSAVQTFTVIGTNTYVTSVATLARFNTNYEGSCIIFDEGTLRFSTGTTSITPTVRMTINNTGSIGIGTSTPTSLLHLEKSQNSTTTLLIQNTADGSGAAAELRFYGNVGAGSIKNNQQISFVRGSGGVDWAIGQPADSDDFVIAGGTNQGDGKPILTTAERMRITSSGTVCIGTTQSSRNLNVYDGIGVRTNRTGTEQEIFFIGATGSGVNDGYLALLDSGTRKVLIAANNARGGDTYFNGGGNVAIGTDTASYRLHVNGTAYATGAAGALSDIRHKNNILNINAGLDAVMLLRPISYLWNEELITDDGMQGLHFGFIAQEVKEILPDVILEQNNEEKTLGLKYNEIIPVLVKAIQEQQAQINELKAQING